jgi:DNA-directed RNA polymerase subunit M/transcription elongation factor TFIIS
MVDSRNPRPDHHCCHGIWERYWAGVFVLQIQATDPTLAHSGDDIKCPQCDHDDAVQFQTPIAREKSNMRLYYVCCNASCRHKWAGDIEGGD